MQQSCAFTGWVYICASEDKTYWVSHFLEYNIVGQGSTPSEALQVVRELAHVALASDLQTGFDPELRRSECTDEDKAPLVSLFERAREVNATQLDSLKEYKEFAVLISVNVDLQVNSLDTSKDVVANGDAKAA